jgi:predicted DNA-binding transcriptional regulator AlpA
MARKAIKPKDIRAQAQAPELLTEPEAAAELGLGSTRFADVQKQPGFPTPVWLGPRGKRFVRAELLTWALAQRKKPREAQR